MKSLGKQKVIENTYMDGIPHHQRIVKKNVYEDVSGRFWTHYIYSKRECNKDADSNFVLDIMVKTIQGSGSLEDVIKYALKQNDV